MAQKLNEQMISYEIVPYSPIRLNAEIHPDKNLKKTIEPWKKEKHKKKLSGKYLVQSSLIVEFWYQTHENTQFIDFLLNRKALEILAFLCERRRTTYINDSWIIE